MCNTAHVVSRYFTSANAPPEQTNSLFEKTMSRTKKMAIGFFLVFLGIQLHLVESYTLTPRVAHFLSDNFAQDPSLGGPIIATQTPPASNNGNQNYQSPYYQASFNNAAGVPAIQASNPTQSRTLNQRVQPPRWICWPILFLGAFLLIQGATQSRGH